MVSRVTMITGVIIIILFITIASYWLFKDNNAVLFSDLKARDAADVVAELERMKIAYELADDGTQILVSGDSVHDVRLKLMSANLPMSGGVGFEIFDTSEFGTTEFAQRINLQRALQGELTRTIMALREVKYARVHLVMPQTSLFKQKQNPPTASITVFLQQDKTLADQQIQGIQRLVAASVPGMEAAMVTVVDQNGTTLSRIASDEDNVLEVSAHLQRKQEVESYLIDKVMNVLERTFGPEQALVSVDVTLNFDQEKTTREEVIPQSDQSSGMLRKRESHSEHAQGKDKGAGETNTEIEYRLGRSVAQIVSTPGSIKRLSVGVLVPAGTEAQRLEQIQDLVAMTVGLNSERGDAIVVHATERQVIQQAQTKDTQDKPFSRPDEISEQELATNSADIAVHPRSNNIEDEWQTESQTRIDMQGIYNVLNWIQSIWIQHRMAVIAAFGVILIVMMVTIGLFVASHRRRSRLQSQKTLEERERILNQLREWISTDELSTQTQTGVK